MKKIDITKDSEGLKPNPVFKGLPKSLKDPKCYDEVESKLMKLIRSDHRHKTASSYVKCAECQKGYQMRKVAMKGMGFKSYAQYLEWKRVMRVMRSKGPIQIA